MSAQRGPMYGTVSRRQFLQGTIGAAVLGAGRGSAMAAQTVGDRLWLWGHPAGSHTRSQDQWGIPGVSTITPAEAARLMGIRNLMMVRYELEPKPPFTAEARELGALDQVLWSVEGGGGDDVDAVLALADGMPNLRGILMDDYFGRVPKPAMWLAENSPQFPVTLTLRLDQPVAVTALRLVQSAWTTGDYRTAGYVVETSPDGEAWQEAARGTVPNDPGAEVEAPLPGRPCAAVRVRIVGTHDQTGARSCGLTAARLLVGEAVINEGVAAEASSEYPGHSASNLLAADPGDGAGPFSLAALRALRRRLESAPRPLELHAVLYTHELQFGQWLMPHIDLCDAVALWTWRAEELEQLSESLDRCEAVIGNKRKLLGLYMWDYGTGAPMPVALMERQCTLGLDWLRSGRAEGLIFLASCICDLGLEAVEWSREWIRAHQAEVLA